MGAGNPLVKSYDDEVINITTFFADTAYQGTVEEFQKQYLHDCGEELSEDHAYQIMSDEATDEFAEIFSVDGLIIEGFNGEQVDSLSAEFRGAGIIFAIGDNVMVVVPTGCDDYHRAFAFVPRRSLYSFWEEAQDENAHKLEWYRKRQYNFEIRMDIIAMQEYKKYIRKCNTEIKKLAANIANNYTPETFKKIMSIRSCAWTSSNIDKTDFKRYSQIQIK